MDKYSIYNIQLIVIFFIFILRILEINSLSYFKSIYMSQNNYLIITSTQFYSYNNINSYKSNIHNFNNAQKINTEKELEMIHLGYFRDGTNSVHLLLIKQFIYAVNNGNYICDCSISDLIGYYSEIYAATCIGMCYYVLGFINTEKKLKLLLIENPSGSCSSNIILSIEINNADSSNINCQFMQSSSNGEVLTCFYQSSNEIVASSFKVNINIFSNTKIIEKISNLIKSKTNSGAKIIKSIISQDGRKSLVCYTNNDNKCNCLIYDIINNEWSNYNTYLTGCLLEISSLNIEYLENKNEYILYCFQSSTNNINNII